MFSFRPHVEHMAYLSHLLQQGGHEIHGFTCDAAVQHCYSRDLRGRSRLRQCPECIIGGIRSFPIPDVWSIDSSLHESLASERFTRLTMSSVTTVQRTEAPEDLRTPEFLAAQRELEHPVATVYANAKRWIAERRLDAVLFFNGRMDLTTGLRAACEDLHRPYITVERSWFGHGLQLIPNENCLGLAQIRRLSEEFSSRPLLPEQAAYAGRLAADRFRQRNKLEWRIYNQGAQHIRWPNAAPRGQRVLILPGSRNEFEGHPDYVCEWKDSTHGLDAVIAYLGLRPANCVVRCHPNWAESIGLNTAWRAERHWVGWAERQGMTIIRSAERADTYGLIGDTDYVLVNGSTAGVEAARRGRRVVCVGPASYQQAGFCPHVLGPTDLPGLDPLVTREPAETSRLALRYLHTYGRRFTQYVPFVRALTTLQYEYFEGADPERIVRICNSGILEPDDALYASDTASEDIVVRQMLAGEWDELGKWQEPPRIGRRVPIARRLGLRWIDGVRGMFARGDL
jgi:hypothetical protein